MELNEGRIFLWRRESEISAMVMKFHENSFWFTGSLWEYTSDWL